jgi:hypothetical protein
MKIKLERKLLNCPNSLNCKVCHQTFEVSNLRTLLYSDRGLLIGDVCPRCLKRESPEIQRLLKQQSNLLMAPSQGRGAQTIASYQQALELLEISAEEIKRPTFYQRWLKHIEIFVQETQELEAARFRLSNRTVEQRSRLEKAFEHDSE